MNKNYSLDDLPYIAKEIIANTKHKVILFYGDMGVGKTTLIKEICRNLGVNDITHSPTFSIVNQYEAKEHTVYHFDFYRITDENEAYDIGIEDYFYSGDWCLIEWPSNIKNLLPINTTEIHLSITENSKRNIKLKNL